MFARRQDKPRFQVDAPSSQPREVTTPQPRVTLPIMVAVKPRPKKRRFQIEPASTSPWAALPFQVVIQRTWRKRRPRLTLAQRRQFARLGLVAGAVVVLLAVIGSTLWLNPAAHDALFPPPNLGPAGGQLGTDNPVVHMGMEQPYNGLKPLPQGGGARPPAVKAPSAFLFDPQRGVLMFQQNSDASYPAASLTKLMTMLLAVDSTPLDQMVLVGPDAAALVNSDNSYMDLSAGEQVSMRDLLYGLVVAGGNDAALAIADQVAGNEPAFVSLMNARAHALGLTHTHFVSADGVDAGNVTSASDMAKLSALLLTRPGVQQITSTYSITIPQTDTHKIYRLQGANQLLPGGSQTYAGAIGMKTGYTDAAGYCMSFAATVNGRTLVGVVLDESSPEARDYDAHNLLDWGFAQTY